MSIVTYRLKALDQMFHLAMDKNTASETLIAYVHSLPQTARREYSSFVIQNPHRYNGHTEILVQALTCYLECGMQGDTFSLDEMESMCRLMKERDTVGSTAVCAVHTASVCSPESFNIIGGVDGRHAIEYAAAALSYHRGEEKPTVLLAKIIVSALHSSFSLTEMRRVALLEKMVEELCFYYTFEKSFPFIILALIKMIVEVLGIPPTVVVRYADVFSLAASALKPGEPAHDCAVDLLVIAYDSPSL
jgi:hypothetical protein